MATHMLQFMFLGNEGFRFPFAHFPTANVTSAQLFELFWDAVDALQMFGFTVRLSISDGAGANRKFVLMHFKDTKEAEDNKYTTISPASGKSLTFMMDPSVRSMSTAYILYSVPPHFPLTPLSRSPSLYCIHAFVQCVDSLFIL